jgi:type II secretory pathway pseudopilin PulG
MQVGRTIQGTAVAGRGWGFTLTEVMVSFGLAAFTVGGIIASYLMAAQRSEWTTASTAAQQLAMDRMAQLRAARWELSWEAGGLTLTNELVELNNIPDLPAVLEIPQTATGVLMATNYVTVTKMVDPRVALLRVDCVWSLPTRGPFTNSLVSYRAPDQ